MLSCILRHHLTFVKVYQMFSGSRSAELLNAVQLSSPPVDFVHTPQNYTLINAHDEKKQEVTFFVFGCGGDGRDNQKKVAELINRIELLPGEKPFVILLGDNFYDYGVTSPTDWRFDQNFLQVYRELIKRGIKVLAIPGNHDENLHFKGSKWGNIDFNLIKAQIDYGRLVEGESSSKLDKMFASDTLDMHKMRSFSMARRFCSYRIGPLLMCMIDSNTFVKDYLKSLMTEKDNPNNQANWLAKTARENPDGINLLFLHHPRKALDRRHYHSDEHYYLTPTETAELHALGIVGNYNDKIDIIIRDKLKLNFRESFVAHTHAMSRTVISTPDHEIFQIGSGGGGGDLEDRQNFADEGCVHFIKEHGVYKVNINLLTRDMIFDLFTVETNLHLKFKNHDIKPIRNSAEETPQLISFRKAILKACKLYFKFLQDSSNVSIMHHGKHGKRRVHNLQNYFNQYEPLTYEAASEFVVSTVGKRWTDPQKNSLEKKLDETLSKYCDGMTYAGLCIEVQSRLEKNGLAEAKTSEYVATGVRYAASGLTTGFAAIGRLWRVGGEVLSRDPSPEQEEVVQPLENGLSRFSPVRPPTP